MFRRPKGREIRSVVGAFANGRSRSKRKLLLQSLEPRHLLAGDVGAETAELLSAPPQASPLVIDLADDGQPGSFELLFANDAFTIHDQAANATSGPFPLAGVTNILINGTPDADTFVLDFSGGSFGVPIHVAGGDPDTDPGDQLVLLNGASESITHEFFDPTSGQIQMLGGALTQSVSYEGLEPIVDNLGATHRIFNFVGGSEDIRLSDDAVAADDYNQIDSSLGEVVTFLNPTGSLTINAGTGEDLVEIDAIDSLSAFADLFVSGDEAADTIRLHALPAGISATLSGGAETDLIVVGSAGGLLDSIAGSVSVDGGSETPGPAITETISAKATDNVVSVADGDRLLINDGSAAVAGMFSVSDSAVVKTASANVLYSDVESLELQTGTGSDTVTVSGTVASALSSIDTGVGDDQVSISGTGAGSLVRISTGTDQDTVTIQASGPSGQIHLDTSDGADQVTIINTGSQSGVAIESGLGDDRVSISGTGIQSVSAIGLGDGQDVANIRGLGAQSVTAIRGGAQNDLFHVSSDANGMPGDFAYNPAGNLDGLLGELCVFGDDNELLPTVDDTLSVKGNNVSASVLRGDELNVSDAGNAISESYSLSTTEFRRGTDPAISFETIESLSVETGNGNDTLTVDDTNASTLVRIDTDGGNDTVSLAGTGDDSLTYVDTGPGNDGLSVVSTGARSLTRMLTRGGDDDVSILSTGEQSGIDLSAGTEVDVATLHQTGSQSLASIRMAGGTDVLNIRGTGLQSLTYAYTGSDNDTINVSSDADGDRVSADGNQAGNLDDVLGEICLSTNSDNAPPQNIEGVSAKSESVTLSLRLGDTVNISDRSSVDNNVYELQPDQFRRVGDAPIIFNSVETVSIETGSGDDTFHVIDTANRTTTRVATNSGNDAVTVDLTGTESILTVDTGVGEDSVTLADSGQSSVTLLATAADDDDVTINGSGLQSGVGVESGAGIDVITVAGMGQDGVNRVDAGDQDDVVNVLATADQSVTDVFAGAGNDTINVSSDADGNRANPAGDLSGNLSGLLGELCVYGEDNNSTPVTAASVSAKDDFVDLAIPRGDALNVSDQGSVTDTDFAIDLTEVRQIGGTSIAFDTIETLEFESGSGNNAIDLVTTNPSTTVRVFTHGGTDSVSILATALSSLVSVDTGTGADAVAVVSTGQQSITEIRTDEGLDSVDVTSSGSSSGLSIDLGTENDRVNVFNTGDDSFTSIALGDGDDVANVQRTASGSFTDILAGSGLDTINVTSTADGTLMDPTGNLNGDLNGILGDVCVFGESQPAVPDHSDSVSGRRTDGDTVQIEFVVAQGDVLNISDVGDIDPNRYVIDQDSLQKTELSETGEVGFESVETIHFFSGVADNTVDVDSTPSSVLLNIQTADGVDTVNVNQTGAGSILNLTTAGEADQVAVARTGTASLVAVQTETGDDSVAVSSVGDQAGIRIGTGVGNDVATLAAEPTPIVRTGDAIVSVATEDGEDVINIEEVFLSTIVDLSSGNDNDVFNLTAGGSDSQGYLTRLNNDPNSPADDAVAASRQLFLDGGANGAANTGLIQQGVVLTPGPNETVVEQTVPGVDVGDIVNVDASVAANTLDLRFSITGPSKGVFATTVPDDPRRTTGNEVLETDSIESLHFVGSAANDVLTVSSAVTFDIANTGQRIAFTGVAGVDKLEIVGTDGPDQITVGDIGGDVEPFEIDAVDFVRVEGGDGNEQIVIRNSVTSVIDTNNGSDIVAGGFGRDLLTGGPGVDYLFGRNGNDVIYVDQNLGDNSHPVVNFEIIDGGFESSVPTGDVCIQYGLDQVRNCEVLNDGGGQLDVLTWLRGILVPAGEVSFSPGNLLLDPFLPSIPTPIAVLDVTETSQLPLAPAPSPLPPVGQGEPESVRWELSVTEAYLLGNPLDTSRDGMITPLDALLVINALAEASLDGATASDWRLDFLAHPADVNRSGTLEPSDALDVIYYLGRHESGFRSERVEAQTIDRDDPWESKVDAYFSSDLAEPATLF